MKAKRWLSWVLIPPSFLLCWPLVKNIPEGALADWASGFGSIAVLALLVFELTAWILMGERWRFFCREHGLGVGLATSTAARLTGFAWSYITPGPHLGGEPIQILYLSRRGYPVTAALSALIRDRGYEFFAGLLTVSLVLLLPGSRGERGYLPLLPALALLMGVAILAASRGAYRRFVGLMMKLSGDKPERRRRVHRFLAMLLRNPARASRKPLVRLLLFVSLIQAPLLAAGEIALFFFLSGTLLSWPEAMALAAVSRAAHYAPVPGAVGVYDAGMLWAGAWMSLDPGTTAAYIMVTRLRDLIQVVIGLMMTSLPVGAVDEH